MEVFIFGAIGAVVLAAACVIVGLVLGRKAQKKPLTVHTQIITERVRSVGKLVGLEVCAKEIATAKEGAAWMPPLLMSQARLVMIFHFEAQYYIDLSELRPEDVHPVGEGRYRVTLPTIRNELMLRDFTPYDVSDGRVLGLFDVLQMNAERQQELKTKAQEQAASMFRGSQGRYEQSARQSIERTLTSLLTTFGATSVEVAWHQPRSAPQPVAQPVATA